MIFVRPTGLSTFASRRVASRTAGVAIDPRLLHFFDLDTGVAIPTVDVPVAAEVAR